MVTNHQEYTLMNLSAMRHKHYEINSTIRHSDIRHTQTDTVISLFSYRRTQTDTAMRIFQPPGTLNYEVLSAIRHTKS